MSLRAGTKLALMRVTGLAHSRQSIIVAGIISKLSPLHYQTKPALRTKVLQSDLRYKTYSLLLSLSCILSPHKIRLIISYFYLIK